MSSIHSLTDAQKQVSGEDSTESSTSSISSQGKQAFDAVVQLVPHVIAGKVPSQQLINDIFSNIIGDAEFDAKNARIKNGPGILLLLEVIDICTDELKATLWSTLTAILKNNIHNLQLCSKFSLIKKAVHRLIEAKEHVADAILELIVVLARHSISVREIKSLIAAMKGDNCTWPRFSIKLLTAMRHIIDKNESDASVFFNFSGKQGGAVALPPIAKWPVQNGFAVVSWFRLDPLVNSTTTSELTPYLYCFRNGKGMGYSAHFADSSLIIETITKPKRKGYSHVVNYRFRPRQWYMIGIVYIYNRFRRSELHCYVDGQEVSRDDLTFVSTSEPFHKCFLGSCPRALPSTVFSGQLGSFYVFTEALPSNTMAAIHCLGPDYRCQFKHGFESDVPLSASQEKLLYDGRLAAAIMFTYNPKACDQKLCLESSPTTNPSYFVHSPHAVMLEGVYPVVTNSFHSALRSIGGIQVIFPLFDQLDYDLIKASEDVNASNISKERDIGSILLSLLCDLLRGSTTCQQQIVQGNGFLVLGRLIDKVSPTSLGDSTLETMLTLGKFLFTSPGKASLLNQWIDHVLLKVSMWIHTSAKVQVRLFSMLATEFVAMPEHQSVHSIDFKRVIGVPRLIHILKYYYWCHLEPYNEKEPSITDGNRPCLSEILSIRAFILLIIKQLLFKGKGIEDEEMRSILHYLTSVKQPENLGDVVEFIVSVIYEQPNAFIAAFDRLNGIQVTCYLLSYNDITIQVCALKIIACFLKGCGNRRKQQLISKTGLLLLIEHKLELVSNILPVATYNALYEILTEKVSRHILNDKHPDLDSSYRIPNPSIFPCMVRLIERSLDYELKERMSSIPGLEIVRGYSPSMLLKKRFLSDLILLLNNNIENRRVFLHLECWQYWLLVLGFSKCTFAFEESRRISDTTCTLFRILLIHALKSEYQGWRIWADTVAFTHIQATSKSYARVDQAIRNTPQEGQIANEKEEDSAKEEAIKLNIQLDEQFLSKEVINNANQSNCTVTEPVTGELIQDTAVDSDITNDTKSESKLRTDKADNEKCEPEDISIQEEKVEKVASDTDAKNDVVMNAERLSDSAPNEMRTTKQQHTNTVIDEDANDGERVTAVESSDNPDNTNKVASDEIRTGAEQPDDSHKEEDIMNNPTTTAVVAGNSETTIDFVAKSSVDEVKTEESQHDVNEKQPEDAEDLHPPTTTTNDDESNDFAAKPLADEVCSESNQATNSEQQELIVDESIAEVVTGNDTAKTISERENEKETIQDTEITQSNEGNYDRLHTMDDGNAINSDIDHDNTNKDSANNTTDAAELSIQEHNASAADDKDSSGNSQLLEAIVASTEPSEHKEDLTNVTNTSAESFTDTDNRDATNQNVRVAQDARNTPNIAVTEPVSDMNRNDSAAAQTDSSEKFAKSTSKQPTASASGQSQRMPSFSWSFIHERLLSDLLFAVENDILSWRSNNRRSVMDYVNARENYTYITNVLHVISMLSDHLIYSCGGIMPLLSSLTNAKGNLDAVQPTQGMEIETAFKFIDRMMTIVDVLVFTSAIGLNVIETERGLSAGSILRQCLRLTFCSSAFASLRNQVDNKVQTLSLKNFRSDLAQLKILQKKQDPMEMYDISKSITDPMKLLQDIDVNRFRAVIYRDVEDTKQAHFLVSSVLYFISSVVVAKYREILDNTELLKEQSEWEGNEIGASSQSPSNDSMLLASPFMIRRSRANTWSPCRIDDTQVLEQKPRLKRRLSDQTSDVYEASNVTAVLPVSDNNQEQNSKDEDSIKSNTKNITNMEQQKDGDHGIADNSMEIGKDKKPIDITEILENHMDNCAMLSQEIMIDFYPYLSRTFVGSKGQDLLHDGISSLKGGKSVVELIMLLTSQEWQLALQKHFGTMFTELITEGRMVSHTIRDQIMSLVKEAKIILDDRLSSAFMKRGTLEMTCLNTAQELTVEAAQYDRMLISIKKRHRDIGDYLWKKMHESLTNELGVWKDDKKSHNVRYFCQDRWEDTWRRRIRLVPNPFGSSHPEATLDPVKRNTDAVDEDRLASIPYALRARQLFKARTITSTSSEIDEDINRSFDLKDDGTEVISSQEFDFGLGGPIVLTVDCSMLAPGVVLPGNLTVTTSTLYFMIDEDNEETKKIDPQILAYVDDTHGRWNFDQIRAVYNRRYLLQNCAIEVFFANRRSVTFRFADSDVVKKVIDVLPPVGIGKNFGTPRGRAISLLSPARLVRKCNMTQKWINREISNFEYIIFLNTMAGRSYNDLNQYPIFPWILTNYTSDEIDLSDRANYRDLSKPIGAINSHRSEKFAARYNTWQDDGIPAFHYGTHYSTAGFTLAFCIRMEPFATLFINMQGKKFDAPDRTFSSIAQAWANCQKDTADVKELIPELFYQPEIFLNNNKFEFGVNSDNEVVNHVKLPPWAKSCDDFIQIHRMALESEYVSQHLNEWVDLIFGYKQRGPEAVKAMNVFYYLTYEGNCDLNSIQDPVMREGIEQQIRNFGQTPSQLFAEPHPPRQSNIQTKDHTDRDVTMNLLITRSVPVAMVKAATYPSLTSPSVITVSCNQVYAINKWLMSTSGGGIEIDPALTTQTGLAQRRLGEPVDQSITPSYHCFCSICDNRFILACGYWDKSFKCFSAETGKLTQSVFGHWDVVTCLSWSVDIQSERNDLIVVSGSRDATILVWSWSQRRERVVGDNNTIGDAAVPTAIVTGHENAVTCVECNGHLGLIVSSSIGGPCLIHTIAGELLHVISVPEYCQRPYQICISNHGLIAINFTAGNGYLVLFTVNGRLLYERELQEQILTMMLSKDGNFLIAGGFRKCVEIWKTRNLILVHTMQSCDSSIRAIDLSNDERFVITGLASGGLTAQSFNLSKWL